MCFVCFGISSCGISKCFMVKHDLSTVFCDFNLRMVGDRAPGAALFVCFKAGP